MRIDFDDILQKYPKDFRIEFACMSVDIARVKNLGLWGPAHYC